MERIEGRTFDEERALYGTRGAEIVGCRFEGPADGESALKESGDFSVRDCHFSLRYPLWHCRGFSVEGSSMDGTARAPVWYSSDGVFRDCVFENVKPFRECDGITVGGSRIIAPEAFWKCRDVEISGSEVESEYFMLDSRDVVIRDVRFSGKYSFQYVSGLEIESSELSTKDAFWHARDVTVRDSVLRGEYLGWYSENLTLVNCTVIGTQPLCYCWGLKLVDCRMEGTDLSFEYSDVDATIVGTVDSVKNPRSGRIVADGYGDVISGDSVMDCDCEVLVRSGGSPAPTPSA